MAEHQTHAVSTTIETLMTSPLFVPLLDIAAGTTLLASQCALTVTGAASPLEVTIMLCEPGTALGDPGTAVLSQSDVVDMVDGEPLVLPGSLPAIATACVLGLSVQVQGLPAGAKVTGTLSTVR